MSLRVLNSRNQNLFYSSRHVLNMIFTLCIVGLLSLGGVYYYISKRRIVPKIKLESAHVLVTGGSSGIGLAIAKYFSARCAKLTIIARDKAKLANAKADLDGGVADIVTVSCDLTASYTVIETAIKEAMEQNGPIDILFNCAGTSVSREFYNSDPKIIEDMMRTNYYSSAFVTRAATPEMIKNKHGIVVYTSSQAGQLGIYGLAAYSASKFALRGLAESLAMEFAPHGISVSIVFPPDTDTPGYAVEQIGKPLATHKISQAAGLISPEDVANAIIPQVLKGNFICPIGFDGWLLGTLTAGMAPPNGMLQSLAETTLCGFFRLISLFYNWWFGRVVHDTLRSN